MSSDQIAKRLDLYVRYTVFPCSRVGINALDVSDWDTTAAGRSVVTNATGTNTAGTATTSRKWKRRCSFPAKSLGPISPTFLWRAPGRGVLELPWVH